MKPTLDEMIEDVKKISRQIVEAGQEHVPIMIVRIGERLNGVQLIDLDKPNFQERISRMLRQLGADAYVFVHEAWEATLSKDSPWAKRVKSGEIRVSELPLDDRQEVVTVIACEKGKEVVCWMARIDVDREGQRSLRGWEKLPGVISGRLVLREW